MARLRNDSPFWAPELETLGRPDLEQLQLAQKSGDGDFYQLSSVEARLHDLRAQLKQEMKEARQQQ